MTDKRTVEPLKQQAKMAFSAKAAVATLLSASVFSYASHAAEQEWWFDVEVILFERNLETLNISEKFKQSRLEQPAGDLVDLLTPYIKPDLRYLRAGLTYCRTSNQLVVKTQYEEDFAFPLPVAETNESALTPSNQPKQQGNQGLTSRADELLEETFEYEVATIDIFNPSDDKGQVVESADAEELNSSYQVLNNNDNLVQQKNAELVSENDLPGLPIHVEFIEWQIPNDIPCAYSEQVDPTFASISAVQNIKSGPTAKNNIAQVPEIINGTEWQQKLSAFLLPSSNMRMKDLYDKITRQGDIGPILHLNWRQEVKFGRENSQTIRLFAGTNFSDQFDKNGKALANDTDNLFAVLEPPTDKFYIPEQEIALLTAEQQQALFLQVDGVGSENNAEDLFARIDNALANKTPINYVQSEVITEQQAVSPNTNILKELWRIDGGITVYLRNVGRVPYLHIDSDLDFRRPIFDPNKAEPIEDFSNNLPELGAITVDTQQQQPSYLQPNFLQSANFNQLRRVISKQIHYFDHPLFGMIVLINRYRWPEEPRDGEEEEAQTN